MDLQSRKIEFIQEFLKIQNEEVLSRLENILKKEKQEDFSPMTVEELNSRIDTSMEDSKNGNLIEATELKVNMEKWS